MTDYAWTIVLAVIGGLGAGVLFSQTLMNSVLKDIRDSSTKTENEVKHISKTQDLQHIDIREIQHTQSAMKIQIAELAVKVEGDNHVKK